METISWPVLAAFHPVALFQQSVKTLMVDTLELNLLCRVLVVIQ